eukprot:m.326252 g.326252  ORF g.326252 m.326252 type:complete len:508 (+) comp20400_c0_seq1:299-1822(+)
MMASVKAKTKSRRSRSAKTSTVHPLAIDVTEFSSPLTSTAAKNTDSNEGKHEKKSTRVREKQSSPETHDTIFHTISEHRPYFISYVMFAQVLIMIIVLFEYSIAPVSLSAENVTGEVVNGFGQASVAHRIDFPNPYIGPSFPDLVFLGAKYSPCMRKNVLEETNLPVHRSGTTGCCLSNSVTGTQCFNSNANDCPITIGRTFENRSCYGVQCCVDPENHPSCVAKDVSSLESSLVPSCTCSIVARPCCVGITGQCQILSPSACAFHRGFFHSNATSCDAVDCFESLCGMGKFSTKKVPDQWYRLLTAPFLSAGVIQLLLILIAEMLCGFDLEKVIGWWRCLCLYTVSTTGAYLVSAIVAPTQIHCGASPAVCGFIACLLVELVQSWAQIVNPRQQLLKVLALVVVGLGLGLCPFTDNVANVAGLGIGVIAATAILPWKSMRRWSRGRRQFFQLLSIVALGIAFMVLFITFYDSVNECSWCRTLNCIDFVSDLCANTGQVLSSHAAHQ